MSESSSPDEVLAQRAEDLEALRQSEHDAAFSGDQRDMSGELSMVGQHPADVSDITFQRELQGTTQRIFEREAAQVGEAQRARANGTYGHCQDCRQPIPAARLEARPEATLCIACQRKHDGPGAPPLTVE